MSLIFQEPPDPKYQQIPPLSRKVEHPKFREERTGLSTWLFLFMFILCKIFSDALDTSLMTQSCFFLAKDITPRIPWFVAKANTVMSTLTDVQSDSTSFRWKSIVGGWLFDGGFFCRIPSWRTCYTSSNGKSTIWRCISYWIWGYSIAMLVYQSVTCVDGDFSSPKQGLISPTYSWITNLTIQNMPEWWCIFPSFPLWC